MRNSRSAWYISKSVPHGLGKTIHVMALEAQDLLVGSDGQDELAVYRLSTGEFLHKFDNLEWSFDLMQGGQESEVYGYSAYGLSRIDLKTGESVELITTSDDPPAQELICGVSPDGRSVLIAARDTGPSGVPRGTPMTFRIRDLTSGELRWELPTNETSSSNGVFSTDGQRIGIQIGNRFQVWDIGKNEKIHDSLSNLGRYPSPGLFPDGRRAFGSFTNVFDLENDTLLSQLGHGYFATIVNDSFLVAEDEGQFYYWRRRRVEGSWSPLNFPEAWLTGALAIACVVNVVGHFRRRNGNGRSFSPDELST